MASSGSVSGIAAAEILTGIILVWAGIDNVTIPDALRTLIKGQPLSQSSSGYGTSFAATAASTTDDGSDGSADGSAIASDALKYNGAGYVFGGAPANGIGDWDCSSFVNWVCGHDLSLAIPGDAAGTYTGTSHGPVVAQWSAWSGLTTVGTDGTDAEPGDIVTFGLTVHMGIATGSNAMISAQDEALGTGLSAINGLGLGPVLVRRYG